MTMLFLILYISSLVSYLFRTFASVLNFFVLLSFKTSLCVLDTSPLLYMYFANVFFQCVVNFLIFFTVSFISIVI